MSTFALNYQGRALQACRSETQAIVAKSNASFELQVFPMSAFRPNQTPFEEYTVPQYQDTFRS